MTLEEARKKLAELCKLTDKPFEDDFLELEVALKALRHRRATEKDLCAAYQDTGRRHSLAIREREDIEEVFNVLMWNAVKTGAARPSADQDDDVCKCGHRRGAHADRRTDFAIKQVRCFGESCRCDCFRLRLCGHCGCEIASMNATLVKANQLFCSLECFDALPKKA